ncbi:MAG: MATE family efflux transporter [Pseudomonadales bacterium]|jgi:putative MATE family efflux protein|nr:MATE family efflux transporter [Pseudomonadales bacterium]
MTTGTAPAQQGAYAPSTSAKAGPDARTRALLEGPPGALLWRLASPNALAFLVQASVSMAEVWFVSRLGTVPLAAIALMFPALMLMQMLANGALGGAVASAVARTLGAGERGKAESLIWHALVIAAIAAAGFYALYLGAGDRILAASGASPAIAAEALRYGDVLFAGLLPVWTMAMLGAVIRGTGNMKLPAGLMIASAAVQVPLAGGLILGAFGLPALGLAGAAVAVVTVSVGSSAILLGALLRADGPVRLHLGACRLQAALFAAIFRVGALAALSPVFTVLTIVLLNGLVARYGVAALAGYGIVARLEFLLVPLVFGIGTALTALVGVNAGAGQLARAERIGWLGAGAAAALTGAVGLLLAVAPGLWVDLFTDDAATRAAGVTYLRIAGPCFAFQGVGLALYFASQGAGTVLWPVVATFLRFAVAVGGAWAGLALWGQGLPFVYGCIAAGMVLYGVLTAASVALGAWRRAAAP